MTPVLTVGRVPMVPTVKLLLVFFMLITLLCLRVAGVVLTLFL
jgi:hypothetical protein